MRRFRVTARFHLHFALLTVLLLFFSKFVIAQTTVFNYQGRLNDGGSPANGTYDLQFRLFDALTGGNQVASTLVREDVTVTNGTFSAPLDFGAAAFPGANRWLEIAVRPGASTGSFTTLSPLQPVMATPYAVQSLNAANATTAQNALQLGNAAADQYVLTSDTRLSDARPPTSGSTSYIQNTASPQASSNFNISGHGTAGGTLSATVVNAATRYDLNGSRALSVTGGSSPYQNSNTFVGIGAGNSTTPTALAFGNLNSLFGISAGFSNTTGAENSFFGANAGYSNTTGNGNSFFGDFAGNSNTTSSNNSFFGSGAGYSNSGLGNSFFGQQSGTSNSSGTRNSFFGLQAGLASTLGSNNSFFGSSAGGTNTSGSGNTLLGSFANVGANSLTNATAVGSNALVSQSNSLVLGSINGVNGATASTNVGIGTSAPLSQLHVSSNSVTATSLVLENLVGQTSRQLILSNYGSTGAGEYWPGLDSPNTSSLLGPNLFVLRSTNGLAFSGSSTAQHMRISPAGDVGIGTAPLQGHRLQIDGGNEDGIVATAGHVAVWGSAYDTGTGTGTGVAGTSTNGSGVTGFSQSATGVQGTSYTGNAVRGDSGTASGVYGFSQTGFGIFGRSLSNYAAYFQGNVYVTGTVTQNSDERLKERVTNLGYGLHEVLALRPVTWTWKDKTQGGKQLGLLAQEVESVLPELVSTTKDADQTKGVNYIGLVPVVIKAIQEQQAQIEQQQLQIKQQQGQIDGLKTLVCLDHPTAIVCQ